MTTAVARPAARVGRVAWQRPRDATVLPYLAPVQRWALDDGGTIPRCVDRCLMTLYINRAAAVATLSELTRPNMGRRTHTAATSSHARLKPCFSGPTATATGPRKSAWL